MFIQLGLIWLLGCGTGTPTESVAEAEPTPGLSLQRQLRHNYVAELEREIPEALFQVSDDEQREKAEAVLKDYLRRMIAIDSNVREEKMNEFEATAILIRARAESLKKLEEAVGAEVAAELKYVLGKERGESSRASELARRERERADAEVDVLFGNE